VEQSQLLVAIVFIHFYLQILLLQAEREQLNTWLLVEAVLAVHILVAVLALVDIGLEVWL
jgi:hypothetical protein